MFSHESAREIVWLLPADTALNGHTGHTEWAKQSSRSIRADPQSRLVDTEQAVRHRTTGVHAAFPDNGWVNMMRMKSGPTLASCEAAMNQPRYRPRISCASASLTSGKPPSFGTDQPRTDPSYCSDRKRLLRRAQAAANTVSDIQSGLLLDSQRQDTLIRTTSLTQSAR